jgi:hypothetical protein
MMTEAERDEMHATIEAAVSAARKRLAADRRTHIARLLKTLETTQVLVKGGAPKAQILEGLALVGMGLEQLADVEQGSAERAP